jgi:hypothetical protein
MAELEYVAAIGASEPETADNCRFESYQTHWHCGEDHDDGE